MTFQNWQEFFDPTPQNLEKGNYFVFEPANQDELLNLFKRKDITKSEKDKLIKALIHFKDQCGGFYQYRGYFLAAKFINTFKNSSFADEIVENLLSWSYDYFPKNGKNFNLERKLVKEAQKVLKYTDRNRVVKAFVKLIETTENETVLLAATQKLIELESDNEIGLSNLVKILQKTQDKKVIFQIINPLFESPELRQKTTKVITETLVRLLKEIKSGHHPDFFWISNTFFYLKQIAVGNQNAIDELINLMKRLPKGYPHEDEYLCEDILDTLGRIGKDNNSAIEILTEFLFHNKKERLSCLAARVLWFVDPGNLLAVDTCIQLLETSTDTLVIHDAALFLLKEEINRFSSTDTFVNKAINSLLDFIKNEQWIDVCGESITTLEKISPNNKTALQGLFQLLDTIEDKGVSLAVAQSILRLDAENQQVLNVFYHALTTTEDGWRLYNIAKTLLKIDSNNEKAREIFHQLLITSKHEQTRLEIAKWLINLDASNQIAIDTLCDLIYMPRIHNCLFEENLALPVLEQIDPTNKLAIKAIEKFCQTTTDQDALIYFIKHLRRLDPGNDIAQKRLDRIIAAVINSMQSYDPEDDYSLLNVGIYWRGIMHSNLLPEIVMALKPYLNNKTSGNCDNYDMAFSIIWDCANKMNYLDFYRAWHQS